MAQLGSRKQKVSARREEMLPILLQLEQVCPSDVALNGWQTPRLARIKPHYTASLHCSGVLSIISGSRCNICMKDVDRIELLSP